MKKKKKANSRILPVILAIVLVIVIAGAAILGVGFGVYGKNTETWFKVSAANSAEQEQPGDIEEPGEQEQPGETEQPGEQEQPGETEEPGEQEQPGETEEPQEPAIEYEIKVGDVLTTVYFDVEQTPDFSKLDFDSDDVLAFNMSGDDDHPLIVKQIALANLGEVEDGDDTFTPALFAMKMSVETLNAMFGSENFEEDAYVLCLGDMDDFDTLYPVYASIDGLIGEEKGWAFSKVDLVDMMDLDGLEDEAVNAICAITAIYHQDFWDAFVADEAFREFSRGDEIECLYFNTDATPDLAALDWNNAINCAEYYVLPLMTSLDNDNEAVVVYAVKIDKALMALYSNNPMYLGSIYGLAIGSIREFNIVYISEDFESFTAGWTSALSNDAFRLYKVYNYDFVVELMSTEPFEGIEYPSNQEEPLPTYNVSANDVFSVLYFNTDAVVDFSQLNWEDAPLVDAVPYIELITADHLYLGVVKITEDDQAPVYAIIYAIEVIDSLEDVQIVYVSESPTEDVEAGWQISHITLDDDNTISAIAHIDTWNHAISVNPFDGIDYTA